MFKPQNGFRLTASEQAELTDFKNSVLQSENIDNIKDFVFALVKRCRNAQVNTVKQGDNTPDNSDNELLSRIAELEKIVEQRNKSIEESRVTMSNKDVEIENLKFEVNEINEKLNELLTDPFYIPFNTGQQASIMEAIEKIAQVFNKRYRNPSEAVHNFIRFTLADKKINIEYVCHS